MTASVPKPTSTTNVHVIPVLSTSARCVSRLVMVLGRRGNAPSREEAKAEDGAAGVMGIVGVVVVVMVVAIAAMTIVALAGVGAAATAGIAGEVVPTIAGKPIASRTMKSGRLLLLIPTLLHIRIHMQMELVRT